MKPFNLEAAKASAPVCTRDGHYARIICYDRKHTNYPIVVLIYFPNAGEEELSTHTKNGIYSVGVADKRDLFMVGEEHYDISNFKPFDKVLVRDINTLYWKPAFYSYYLVTAKYPFNTIDGVYSQCIPYNEETAHLVGTTDMPPKKYINW